MVVYIATSPTYPIIAEDCGGAIGSAYISVSAGTPPYDYLWSTGDTVEDLIDVGAGIYTVTVTGADNCAATEMAEMGYLIFF